MCTWQKPGRDFYVKDYLMIILLSPPSDKSFKQTFRSLRATPPYYLQSLPISILDIL